MVTTTNKTNSKFVKTLCKEHVLDSYDSVHDLQEDVKAAGSARNLVEGGSFLIYYTDQREFLNSLHLNNNSNREFSDDEVYRMHTLLVERAIKELI